MSLQITGKVIEVLGIVVGTSATSGKEWKKQEFLIETVEQYPKKIHFVLFGEQKINTYGNMLFVGNMVDVFFDVSTREWTSKEGKRSFFTSCNAYDVRPTDGVMPAPPQTQAVAQPTNPSAFEQAQMMYGNPVVPSNPPAPQDPFANQGATDTDSLPF